jgi:hypothetical protein
LGDVFDQVYDQYSAEIPATATIDAASLGVDASGSISQALSDAESGLRDARSAIGTFRIYYALLIAFMLLLIAGIALIHRQVKGATRDLGIVFLAYGVTEYIGIMVGRYFIRLGLDSAEMPESLRAWVPGLLADFFRPLEILTLALAALGIALIVISIVYRGTPPRQQIVGSDQQS